MKRFTLLALSILMVWSAGCGPEPVKRVDLSFKSESEPLKIKGEIKVLSKHGVGEGTKAAGDAYAFLEGVILPTGCTGSGNEAHIFCNIEEVKKENDENGVELVEEERLEPKHPTLISVDKVAAGRDHKYLLVLFPPPTVEPGKGWLTPIDGSHPSPTFLLKKGTTFSWMDNAIVDTDWVHADAIGTSVIVRIAANHHIVYLRKKGAPDSAIRLNWHEGLCDPNPAGYAITEEGTGIKFYRTGNTCSTQPATSTDIPDLSDLEAVCRKAGWNPDSAGNH